MYHSKFRETYKQYLSKRSTFEENDQLICLLHAAVEVLKIRDAQEVLSTFCRSERVSQDMKLALSQAHKKFEEHFIVRKWIDIEPDMEFRGFYCNGKLNALSQYNHLCYFERLLEMRDQLLEKVLHFFELSVKPKLAPHFSSFIVDFAITGNQI